jgi:phenylacetate-CoA ligase
MDKMAIYNWLPIWGQNLACCYEGSRIKRTRYGKAFWRYLAEYENHNDWSYEQLCDYRDARLRKMIHHCYDTVPYYTKLFKDSGINPDSIKTIDDLKVMPILTKDEVKANIDSLTSAVVPKNEIKIHPTGGTTGAGLNFRTTNHEENEQWAVWWRYRRRHGITVDTWCANFGGKVIVPLKYNKPPFWRINRPGKQIFYSGYHLCGETALLYAQSLKKSNIRWIHGYPSNVAVLASFLIENGIQIPMSWVSIGAENLYDNQKKQIEAAFGTRPLQHYGLTEGVANISEQEDGILTVDEDFSCVEFLPDATGNSRIVGTTLTNYAMPLLRYDTGDYAIISQKVPAKSGRIVDGMYGRSNEYVILPNGVKVGTAAISLILSRFTDIQRTQIVQSDMSSIIVNIVLSGGADHFKDDILIRALRERLGGELKISIIHVSDLKKTNSGKYKLVISSL